MTVVISRYSHSEDFTTTEKMSRESIFDSFEKYTLLLYPLIMFLIVLFGFLFFCCKQLIPLFSYERRCLMVRSSSLSFLYPRTTSVLSSRRDSSRSSVV